MSYEEKLEIYLRNKLRDVVSEDFIEQMLSKNNLKIWASAFTHKTFSFQNYERLETIGDAVIKTAFYDYIFESLPFVEEPKIYSELEKYYNSKTAFIDFAVNEGMDKFLRKKSEKSLPNKVISDLFESFNGALFEIGNIVGLNSKVAIPLGYLFVKNYITLIFNQVDIDIDRIFGSFQSQLKEISKKLKIRIDEIITANPVDKKPIVYYYVSRNILSERLNFLGLSSYFVTEFVKLYNKGKNYIIEDKKYYETELDKNAKLRQAMNEKHLDENPLNFILLGQATGGDLENAESNASRASLKTLEKLGITRDIAQEYSEQISNPEFSNLMKELKKHFVHISFDSDEDIENETIVRYLIVKKKFEKPYVLVSKVFPIKENFDLAKLKLLKLGVESIQE